VNQGDAIFLLTIFVVPFVVALFHAWRGKASLKLTPLIAMVVCIGVAAGYVWSIFDELDITAKPMAPLGVVFYSFCAAGAFVSGLGLGFLGRRLIAVRGSRAASRDALS